MPPCVYVCVFVLATPLLLQLALAMPSEFISFPLHAHFVQFFFAIKKSLQGNEQKKNNKNARMNDRAKNGKKREKMQRGVEKKKKTRDWCKKKGVKMMRIKCEAAAAFCSFARCYAA